MVQRGGFSPRVGEGAVARRLQPARVSRGPKAPRYFTGGVSAGFPRLSRNR